jgi:hypothetical protein
MRKTEERLYFFLPPPPGVNVIKAIEGGTKPDDTVLVWGAQGNILVNINRRSPTRYFYQYPLFLKGYGTLARMNEFIGSVKAARPKYIMDTSAFNRVFPSLNPFVRQHRPHGERGYADPPGIEGFYSLVEANYREIPAISSPSLTVYRRLND